MGVVLLAMFMMAGTPKEAVTVGDLCKWKVQSLLRINHPGNEWSIVIDKNGVVADQTTFPVYGNWCGPDHPKPGSIPIPTDELDTACMVHDQCYAKQGYLSCACDQALLDAREAARARKQDTLRCLNEKGRWTRIPNPVYGWISGHFATSPCKGGCKKTAAGREVCDTEN